MSMSISMTPMLRGGDTSSYCSYSFDTADVNIDTANTMIRDIGDDVINQGSSTPSSVLMSWDSIMRTAMGTDMGTPTYTRRYLVGKQCYTCPEWVMTWVIIGITVLYCGKFIIIPNCKKFHHYCTKRRVTNHLDGFDEHEFEEELMRTKPYLNQAGEIVFADPEAIAAQQRDKRSEIQIMLERVRTCVCISAFGLRTMFIVMWCNLSL